jgi:hypothetical protein
MGLRSAESDRLSRSGLWAGASGPWSWGGEPVDGGELVGSPDRENDEEGEAGKVDGATPAQAGVAADEDHEAVGQPHGEGEEDLGIEEVMRPDGLLSDPGADEEAGGHAGKAEEEALEGDLVGGLERREPGEAGGLALETALLHEIEQGGQEREEEAGVGGEEESDVEEDPGGAERQEGLGAVQAGTEGGEDAEQEGQGKDEDAESDGAEAEIDGHEGEGEQEGEEGLELVGLDGQAVVGGDEHLDERDEVEEHSEDGRGDGDGAPAGTVVERRGQDRECSDAVEKDRDFEPEERHLFYTTDAN